MGIPLVKRFTSHITLIVVFAVVTPIAIAVSLLTLFQLNKTHQGQVNGAQTSYLDNPTSGVGVYASLPTNPSSVDATLTVDDARCEIIRQYLEANRSPLEPYACYIVQTADEYGVDWRIFTAVAQKESGLCRVIPPDSHNCTGWGIHSEGTLKFDTYEEGILAWTKGIKQNYIDKGYVTVDEIMGKYAHPDSTTWADGVNHYMGQLN